MEIKVVDTPNGPQLLGQTNNIRFSSKQSSRKMSWGDHKNRHLPKWFKKQAAEEAKVIRPFLDSVAALEELRKTNHHEGDYEELKAKVLEFHYEELRGIRKETLENLKRFVRHQELYSAI